MAKKKNSQKKHTFKHSPSVAAPAADVSTSAVSAPAAARSTAAVGTPTRDFSYVAGDMKRIGLIAAGLVAIELILYVILTHTSAGTAIYNLVKI